VDGNSVLQWACAGNVWQLGTAQDAPVALIAEGNTAINESFKYQQLGDDRGVILFAQNAMDGICAGSSLCGVYCVDGQWGEIVTITEHAEGMYVDSFDACYYKEFTLEGEFFPENLHLKHTVLKVGMVNISTPISDSGSPVFALKNGKKCLVGTTSISRKDPDATGFINIDRWISPVVHTFNGGKGVKLSACPDLW
jgi:hypothetical protein